VGQPVGSRLRFFERNWAIVGTNVSPPGPWDAFAIVDGRIVTRSNPASAHKTAEEALKTFDNL
jgi:putative intracellular protease/amidase